MKKWKNKKERVNRKRKETEEIEQEMFNKIYK